MYWGRLIKLPLQWVTSENLKIRLFCRKIWRSLELYAFLRLSDFESDPYNNNKNNLYSTIQLLFRGALHWLCMEYILKILMNRTTVVYTFILKKRNFEKNVFTVSVTGGSEEKKRVLPCRTYGFLFTSPDALPLSHRRLVGASRPLN